MRVCAIITLGSLCLFTALLGWIAEEEVGRLPRLGMHAYLIAVVLVAFVPAAVVMLSTVAKQHADSERKAEEMVLQVARAAAARHDLLIEGARELLLALAALPQVRDALPENCNPTFAALLRSFVVYANIGVVDRDRRLICSALEVQDVNALQNAVAIKEALRTRSFAVGDYLIGAISGKPIIGLAYPVLDREGEVDKIVFASLDSAWLGSFANENRLPVGSSISLVKADGTILARYPDAEGWTGQSLYDHAVGQAIRQYGEGTTEAAGFDGLRRLYGYVSLRVATPGDAYIVTDIPADAVLADANDFFIRNVTAVGLAALLALAGAGIISNVFVLHRLKALVQASTRLSRGDLSARIGRIYGPKELNDLAQAFDEMAAAMESREREAKSAEEEIRRAEERLRLITHSAGDAIVTIDSDKNIVLWNRAAETIFGYSAAEIIGKSILILVPDHIREMAEGTLSRMLTRPAPSATEKPIASLGLRKDGSEFHMEATFASWRTREGVFLTVIVRDITERVEAESMFRTLANHSPIGIYIAQNGKFVFANPTFQQYSGFSEAELLDMRTLDLVAPEDRAEVRARAIAMLKGEMNQPYRFRIINRDGEIRWIMETVVSIEYRGARAVVGSFMDVTELKQAEEQLEYLACHDPLTGLANRRSLEAELRRAVARARRGVPSALLFLDIDNFKKVNDTLGHAVGDQLLQNVTQTLRQMIRTEDLLARLGGDEFAVVLEGVGADEAYAVAERVRQAIERSDFAFDGLRFDLSVSIGIVEINGEDSAEMALARADAAMYRAKDQGRNRIVIHQGQGGFSSVSAN